MEDGREDVLAFDHDVCVRKHLIGVATGKGMVVADVALVEVNLAQSVEEPTSQMRGVMQERSPRRQRLIDRGGCRELLVRNLDKVQCRIGDGGRFRGNGRDRLADEADSINGENRSILERMTVVRIRRRQILPGHDRNNARQCLGRAGVDGDDASVGIRATQHATIGHAMEAEIASELRFALDFGQGVRARCVGADNAVGGASGGSAGHEPTSTSPATRRAASSAASRMFQYPVQRQRLPPR